MQKLVSIVIPVFNDQKNLRACLESIYDCDEQNFDVIVVDDCSSQDIKMIVNEFPCQYIRLPFNKGQAYARNCGVKSISSEIILFTDSDCRVMKNWVKRLSDELVQARRVNNIVTVCGQVQSAEGFIEMSHTYTGYAYVQKGKRRFIEALNTSCTAIFREDFWKVGGFSEDMRVSGEDQDLALKLVENNRMIVFEPSIWVTHNHGVHTFKDMVLKHTKWGSTLGLSLMKKHPQKNRILLPLLSKPAVHFFLIIPLAIATTLKIVLYNFKSDKRICVYSPIILINKIFYRWGIFIKSIEPLSQRVH